MAKKINDFESFDDYFDEQMKDPAVKKEYDEQKPEFDIIHALVEARTESNMTQKELSEKSGINQADISKIENGTRNPSLKMLKKLADGMGMTLQLRFVPKRQAKNI